MVELSASYVLGCLSETAGARFESHLREGCQICNAEISRVSLDVAALAQNSTPAISPVRRERFLIRMKNEADSSSPARGILLNSSGMFIVGRGTDFRWRHGD